MRHRIYRVVLAVVYSVVLVLGVVLALRAVLALRVVAVLGGGGRCVVILEGGVLLRGGRMILLGIVNI